MRHWTTCLAAVALGWASLVARADAPATQPAVQPATQPSKFIRFVDRGNAGGELDTADVAYTNGHGISVHLVAAVHIGERAYYQRLAKSFEGYDAVLYELVKPKDSLPPAGEGAGEKSQALITRFQVLLKNFLNLDFQLDVIDYTKPNFVNADLDKETFEKMQAERGESMMSLMLQQMMNVYSHPPVGGGAGNEMGAEDEMHALVRLMLSPDGQRQFKLVVARQMDDLEDTVSGLNGPDGSVILTERNKAAMKILDQTIAGGKKTIVIFYGAAHMPDMSQRLMKMGFTPTDTQWRMAWDLTIRPDQPSMAQKMLDDMIDAMGDK